MKNLKISLLAVASLMLANHSNAQYWCATDEMRTIVLNQYPEARARLDESEKYNAEFTKHAADIAGYKSSNTLKIIPVVFHVLHLGGPENISDAQIYDEMNILNRDYQKQNADTIDVVPSFANNIANIEIEFRLAQLDPNGNCTNGIERFYDANTNWDRSAANNNGYNNYTHTWDPTKYLNIYVVKMIDGTAAAYTYVPGTWAKGVARDAIVSRYDYVGSIGASSVYNARTLTHEIGHWFGLYHPWGSTNAPGVSCGDDFVSDTPITKGSIVGVCNKTLADCNPPTIENVQNYMDYSYCDVMFTNGQKTRMMSALSNPTVGRNNLWTSTNLTATGTTGTPPVLCAPIADFYPDQHKICAGATVSFNDWSYNGAVASRNWSFPGGVPSTDTSANPVITYPNPGLYDVTLSVTNSAGTSSVTHQQNVKVEPAIGSYLIPYSEGFETIAFPADFEVQNEVGNAWNTTNTAAYTGSKSLLLRNFSGNPSGVDAFITPSYTFQYLISPKLYFRIAFAVRSATSTDMMKIYVSTDCGKTWQVKYSKSGNTLATAGIITSNFVPNASQWRLDSITNMLSVLAGKPNVRFKFEYTQSSNGNNLYIDDINITTNNTGINDLNGPVEMELYPNPSNGESTLAFSLPSSAKVSVRLFDVAGRMVSEKIKNQMMPAGIHNLIVGSNVNPGIYFVELTVNGNRSTQKLIIQ